MATEARVLDDSAMLQVIRTGVLPDGSKWDPLRTALVEAEVPGQLATTAQEGRAEITRYEPNRVSVQTNSSGNSILVLSENDYPGWRVYVDGQSADVLRVNYAQRGVLVPAGDHQVSFLYRPWSVLGGFLVSLNHNLRDSFCNMPSCVKDMVLGIRKCWESYIRKDLDSFLFINGLVF